MGSDIVLAMLVLDLRGLGFNDGQPLAFKSLTVMLGKVPGGLLPRPEHFSTGLEWLLARRFLPSLPTIPSKGFIKFLR